jgi:hypothetical protein
MKQALAVTVEPFKFSLAQPVAYELVLTIKPASAIRRGIIEINGPSTCCAEAEAASQSSNPMDPDIYFSVQLGLTR